MPSRDVFPGHDEPGNIESEPEEILKSLLTPEAAEPVSDAIEPELDG